MNTIKRGTARYLRRAGYHHFLYDADKHLYLRCNREDGTPLNRPIFAADADHAKRLAAARNAAKMHTAVPMSVESRARYNQQ